MHITKPIYRTAFWTSLVALLIVSSVPDIPVNTTIDKGDTAFRLDYLLHFIAYAFIGLFYVLSYKPSVKGFLMLTGFAALEELHQYWIPGRTLNPVDFGFDVGGLITVILLWLAWYRLKKLSTGR